MSLNPSRSESDEADHKFFSFLGMTSINDEMPRGSLEFFNFLDISIKCCIYVVLQSIHAMTHLSQNINSNFENGVHNFNSFEVD